MNREDITAALEQLKNGTIEEFYVPKIDFLPVRNVLINREDFKHFQGIAQRGGDVVYKYTKSPRS
ncbi:hypothetical protein [Bacillus sp. B15-48]|uniref:hypothetical protein n=1 Tax=Bacillus sp. B15-48 TaxID=1548601 RepID=UPI00193EC6D6|nr:hypothetical protein [Bacillus sp. B15-48]MBM4764332.1 hypothetical protein [Bacillus sp. B15-48]